VSSYRQRKIPFAPSNAAVHPAGSEQRYWKAQKRFKHLFRSDLMKRHLLTISLFAATVMFTGTSIAAEKMKDTIMKDCMEKSDSMKKDAMMKDGMKKDAMMKDGMKKDAMMKDGMKKK